MANRFVCTKCRKNITEIELSSAKITRTRYNGKVHTFCPHCDTHITSFGNDKYEKIMHNLSKTFMVFGCRIICYYEGSVEVDKNIVDYKPPIFRITDTEDKLFYRLACRLKQINERELDDIYIVNEDDGSFSIIGGAETWYFNTESANKDLNKYLILVKKVISILIKCGKKHMKLEV